MTIEFSITPQETQEARSVHLRFGADSGSRGGAVLVAALLICCAAAWLLNLVKEPGETTGYVIVASVALLLLLLVAVVVIWARSPKPFEPLIERTFLPEPRASGSFWSFDATGITAEHGCHRANFKWTAVRKAVESEHLFLIYTSERRYSALPKRAFTQEQLDVFRQLLQDNIRGPIAAFPVICRHADGNETAT